MNEPHETSAALNRSSTGVNGTKLDQKFSEKVGAEPGYGGTSLKKSTQIRSIQICDIASRVTSG
jgi:hypothetical protein